jgi:hypothetical protein
MYDDVKKYSSLIFLLYILCIYHAWQCNSFVFFSISRSPPWLGWPLWNIYVTNGNGYVPLVVSTSRFFPHSWLVTRFVTRLTRRVPLVEQELLTLPENLSSPPVICGIRVTRSLVLCVCFVDRCLSFCAFSFGHCVVCSSSIYSFWLLLWYLQTLLKVNVVAGYWWPFTGLNTNSYSARPRVKTTGHTSVEEVVRL